MAHRQARRNEGGGEGGGDRSLTDRFGNVIDRAESFDPREAAREAARAEFEEIQEPLEQGIERLRGQQVGRGRLDTGFGFDDEDRLVRRFQDTLARTLARNAIGTAGLQLEGIGLTGDLISGGLDRETAERNAKRSRRGGLLGALGAGVGLFFGGPAGAQIGGLIGGGIGGAI